MAKEFYKWSPKGFVEITCPHLIILSEAEIKISEKSNSEMKRILEDKILEASKRSDSETNEILKAKILEEGLKDSDLKPLPPDILVILKLNGEFDQELRGILENGKELDEGAYEAGIRSMLMVVGMDELKKLDVYVIKDST